MPLCRRLVLCVFACLFLPIAQAQSHAQVKDAKKQASTQKNLQQQQPVDAKTKQSDSDVIKVTIGTSRPTVTTDGAFGITGYLKNVSDKPVAIYTRETTLVVQPEVTEARECVFELDAFFPTEPPSIDVRGPRVVIRPNEGYQVTWDVNRDRTKSCDAPPLDTSPKDAQPKTGGDVSKKTEAAPLPTSDSSWRDWLKWPKLLTWGWWRDTANFVPGNYVFIVSGKAYDVKTDSGYSRNNPDKGKENVQEQNQNNDQNKEQSGAKCDCESNYHTYSESVILNVAVPQIQVVFFSALGGLLAYLMLIFAGGDELKELRDLKMPEDPILPLSLKVRRVTGFCRRALSAILTSSLVTVVTSRVSAETLLPIKVSVNDMWGALTFGFIAYFLGGKFIDWLKEFTKKKPAPKAADQQPEQKNENS